MNQSEIIASPIGDGVATICECSNVPTRKIPRLTIMTPYRVGGVHEKDQPATSMYLVGASVDDLYDFLHNYYETNAEANLREMWRIANENAIATRKETDKWKALYQEACAKIDEVRKVASDALMIRLHADRDAQKRLVVTMEGRADDAPRWQRRILRWAISKLVPVTI